MMYWKLQKKTLDHTAWIRGFLRGYGAVVRQCSDDEGHNIKRDIPQR
jgi:hypothetical protein